MTEGPLQEWVRFCTYALYTCDLGLSSDITLHFVISDTWARASRDKAE